MKDIECSIRIDRLLNGQRRLEDISTLLSHFRDLAPHPRALKEIGDLAAHNDQRDRGITVNRAKQIKTSARLWLKQLSGERPTIKEIEEAGNANLKIIPDSEFVGRTGLSKSKATQEFKRGIKDLKVGRRLGAKRQKIVQKLGLSFMWQFAFSDAELIEGFAEVAAKNKFVARSKHKSVLQLKPFLTLHALTLFHGSRLLFDDQTWAPLSIAKSEELGTLMIKAHIQVTEAPKPTTISVPMFQTCLEASNHCDPALVNSNFGFDRPIELNNQLRLVELSI